MTSTTSTIALLRPVEATAPTIIPAQAIATATETIFMAPLIIPLAIFFRPSIKPLNIVSLVTISAERIPWPSIINIKINTL